VSGFQIPKVELHTEVSAAKLDEANFQQIAETAKQNCPVSKLFAGAEITLKAKLV
jgi:osmotically inducible protein OsmC